MLGLNREYSLIALKIKNKMNIYEAVIIKDYLRFR